MVEKRDLKRHIKWLSPRSRKSNRTKKTFRNYLKRYLIYLNLLKNKLDLS